MIMSECKHDPIVHHRSLIGTIFLLVMALVLLFLTGCGGTRTTTVAIDEPSSVRTALPDTLLNVQPTRLPIADVRTRPIEVQRFAEPDTTSPARLFTALTFDRDTDRVRIRLQGATYTYHAPARGEALHVTPDTTGSLQAGITGTPTPQRIEVEAPPQRSWWSELRYTLYIGAGLLALVLLIRLLR